ncbi:MAG: arginine repressor [Lachnospiraceae bacterium]|nr:arginine repressor [Lachnospiraceae bacterium]
MARKKTSEDLNKASRWEMILKLISGGDIATQKELAQALAENGFSVAQATLSRDIKELHLVKAVKADGSYVYQAAGKSENRQVSSQFYQLFKNSVRHVDNVLNQVVIHTFTGMAQAVCASFDGLRFEGVLGTIAGDDTILLIARDEHAASEVAKQLREITF